MLVSFIVSIFGFLPSAFVTAANVLYFGYWEGFLLSFLGEAFGALIAFYLYRFGVRRLTPKIDSIRVRKWTDRLAETNGRDAFWLIVLLRVLPFIPSGLVTLLSATSRVSPLIFFIASTLGKIPALFIEVASVSWFIGSDAAIQWVVVGVVIVLYAAHHVYKQYRSKQKTPSS
ncbi:TVP38/TMEM64 family protein [Exiguobacterium oxidotolerans]|uniref:TVP38/TMEM64 family protein n=1 Tax=Exiguobacterium oxidotolerans TaxID=223958 RepID=UPI000B0F04C1|nr:VTT domain-containing protein [Exiguobacterium oxidotolerans]